MNVVRGWIELISDPITFKDQEQTVFQHDGLPIVKDELSVTLRLKLQNHTSSCATIFHKGTEDFVRTPGLWLSANKSALNARFTGNWDSNAGITELEGLLLNKWYHITYTLSDIKKRLDIYIDGEWSRFYSIQDVKMQKVVFNDGPLYIGRAFSRNGFNGIISNVRYFNWRLSTKEVKEQFTKKPITYGSKVSLVHILTGKYLSSKGVRFPPPHSQYMVIGNGREIDLNNDVWIVEGANEIRVSAGGFVHFNTAIGFKYQKIGEKLHSHGMDCGETSKSKYKQVTLFPDKDGNDDWNVRRYSPNSVHDDSGHLMDGDIISIFHILGTDALFSHSTLLDDGTQEVACHGNGNEENHKWCIELID